MSTPTKRGHEVSRFYLKGWSSSPGLVHRYDKSTGRWREISLKKQAGVVPHAYTQRAEDWLADNVETPAAPVIERVRTAAGADIRLKIRDRDLVAAFILESYLRTMSARRRMAAAIDKLLAEDPDASVDVVKFLTDARQEIETDPSRAKSALVRDSPGFHDHRRLRAAILTSQWSLYCLADSRRSFVTSDDPVLRFPTSLTDDHGPMPAAELDHVVMPISPTRVLVCRRRSGRLYERLSGSVENQWDADVIIRMYAATRRQCDYINLSVAKTAWKHVFARKRVPIGTYKEANLPAWRRFFPDAPKGDSRSRRLRD